MKNIYFLITGLLIIFNTCVVAQEDCLMCHSDDEMTYERAGKEISLYVNEETYANSAHGDMECVDCHENFDGEELPHREGKNIYKVNCGMCHDEQTDNAKNDIHHRMLKGRTDVKPPECTTCHGVHDIKNLSKVRNKSREFCSSCHTDISLSGTYHKSADLSDESCADCHEDVEEITTHLAKSMHPNLSCTDCHNYVAENFEEHASEPDLAKSANCNSCHAAVAKEHKESIHGISLSEDIDEAAQCWSCHGSHLILSSDNEESSTNPVNLAATCGTCHDDPAFVEKFSMSVKNPSMLFTQSIHGKLVSNGETAPDCVTCHGVHNIKNRVQQGSQISSFNVPNTCEPCHSEITEEYKESIHWIQAKRGVRESPVCNDCHSEHAISAVNTDKKKAAIKKLQEETCFQCHQNPMIAKRYGLSGDEAISYQDSYHGLAVMRGDEDAALCVDCHGVHKILPKNHPESMVSVENVTSTCQTCHEDANDTFSKSYSHTKVSDSVSFVDNIVSELYFWLIVVVIGGMVLHNALIFFYEIRKRRKKSKNVITIPRFTTNEVIQHVFLFTSFIILAITGFALKFPESWWAEGLHSLGMTETIRQYTHRVSAVIMMVLGLYHIGYLFATRRGRDVLFNLIPKLDDARQAVDNILYYLRIKKTRPEFDKYDYTEKAEYWALIWGTLVMGITGLILWFPTLVGSWAPVWLIKVSETIHFYEAILATLAIIVWHWFFVIFHPGEYPMSFVWIDGKMSLDHYRHHHEKHFKKVVLQWYKFNNDMMNKKDISHSVELFLDTFEKNELNPNDILQEELNKDAKLRLWLEKEIGPKEDKEKK